MGSDSSKFAQFGNIFIETGKSYYFAGETITGTLYLNLIQMYPGNAIYLKLKGTECCLAKLNLKEVGVENVPACENKDEDLWNMCHSIYSS